MAACAAQSHAGEPALRIGSKSFTESVILAEIGAGLVRATGQPVEHIAQLGGTRVLSSALERGEIDVYPEYTGTIAREVLGAADGLSLETMTAALAARGLRMSAPLGFDDGYALGMKEDLAGRLDVHAISQLAQHPDLVFGFTNEFIDRNDGWPGLQRFYGLPQRDVRGLDHDLAYRGLAAGAIQVTDLYSTDADILYYGLRVLEDDRGYFPRYQAVWLMRTDLEQRAPAAVRALGRLEGRIASSEMVALNARAKLDRVPEVQVAAELLADKLDVRAEVRSETRVERILQRTLEHLAMVMASVGAAIVCAVPLGIWAARTPLAGRVILAAVGIVQTVPSLALLVVMIPVFGIGTPTAMVALFLYGLLPITRNTLAGLQAIPLPLRESAEALGLDRKARLWAIELPLASPAIVAGIKTSAVINVGTATIGALVGAGGYGQPILTGIRLDDVGLILEGALPAAAMALVLDAGFGVLERLIVPKGLRLASAARSGG